MKKLPGTRRKDIQPDDARLAEAIARGLAFLQRNQLPGGEFKTYASSDKRMRHASFDSSPFVTAWVLDSIAAWDSAPVRTITKRALRFLLREMEGPGLWRYWSSRNEAHAYLPPDVDDTCCVSAVLRPHEKAPANRAFILANRNEEGLFYTWMVPRQESPRRFARALEPLMDAGARLMWSLRGMLENVDPGVNANAVMYLGERAETRPAIGYLIEVICGKRAAKGVSFYPDAVELYYLISRAYASGVQALGETKGAIIEKLLARQKRNGTFGNELLTAFGLCTLLNFEWRNPEAAQSVQYLLDGQGEDGAWQRVAAFLGPAPYYGSEELTTALCIGALARYRRTAD